MEDIVQETLAKAIVAMHGFHWQGENAFMHWLNQIAERVILKLARTSGHDEVMFVNYMDLLGQDDIPSLMEEPGCAMRRQERFDRLQMALDQLRPHYREVINLVRLKGLPTAEVARRMGRSPDSVAHLLFRAMKQLKKAVGDSERFRLPADDLMPTPFVSASTAHKMDGGGCDVVE